MADVFINLDVPGLQHTSWLIKTGNLRIHPCIERVVLHGSRGLLSNFRQDSDLDLSLLIPSDQDITERLCHDIVNFTLESWSGSIELDLAVIFDTSNCHLACFDSNIFSPQICAKGRDCLGIAKFQNGHNGIIDNPGVEVELMYPCLLIYDRRASAAAV